MIIKVAFLDRHLFNLKPKVFEGQPVWYESFIKHEFPHKLQKEFS